MFSLRLLLLTTLTMVAFAANSVLCRLALAHTGIDAATFTAVRLLSGAAALWLIVRARRGASRQAYSWPAALALFTYVATFSFAYLSLTTGTGALLLFGAVQVTMILSGLRAGERLNRWQSLGLTLALGGLVYLVLPGLAAPPPGGAALMMAAGAAWGIYSLLGRGAADPIGVTAGNFLRAAPLALGLALVLLPWARLDGAGIGYAVLSGALASGVGYSIWYAALRGHTATSAATVQLSVPVLAAMGGVLLLGEPVTPRLVLASLAILGGIALVLTRRRVAPRVASVSRP